MSNATTMAASPQADQTAHDKRTSKEAKKVAYKHNRLSVGGWIVRILFACLFAFPLIFMVDQHGEQQAEPGLDGHHDDREHGHVTQRVPERRVGEQSGEIVDADEPGRVRADCARVGECQSEGQNHRNADEQQQEDGCGQKHRPADGVLMALFGGGLPARGDGAGFAGAGSGGAGFVGTDSGTGRTASGCG